MDIQALFALAFSFLSILAYLLAGAIYLLLRTLLLDLHLWIPLVFLVGWLLLRGERRSGEAAIATIVVLTGVLAFDFSGNRILCVGQGLLSPVDFVRTWRTAMLERLRQEAATPQQVAIAREAFRLLEACVRERGALHHCRLLLREDARDACKVLDCFPYGRRPGDAWHFRDSPIRAIIFASDPEGFDVVFRLHVALVPGKTLPRPQTEGHILALAATLRLYPDSLTNNLCPAPKLDLHQPKRSPPITR